MIRSATPEKSIFDTIHYAKHPMSEIIPVAVRLLVNRQYCKQNVNLLACRLRTK